MLERWGVAHWAGLLIVLVLHGAAIYGLWRARLPPSSDDATTVFVSFIDPPAPVQRPEPEPRLPLPPKPDKPRLLAPPHDLLAAQAPVLSPIKAVTLPSPEVAVAKPEPSAQSAPLKPVAPVSLTAELSVSCPVRTAPDYPPLARRLGETGKVVLQVELDEGGRVASSRVVRGSGSRRLDEAALAAVGSWRCNPAQRDGRAVRAVALQPFDFILEGR